MKINVPKILNIQTKNDKNRTIVLSNKKETDHPFTRVKNIGEYLSSLQKFGTKTMFVWKNSGIQHEMTFSDFTSFVYQLANGFAMSFGSSGKRIAVIGDSSPQWIASYLAIIASGNTAVPMDKDLDPKQIVNFFDLAEVVAVVYSEKFNESFSSLHRSCKTLRHLIPINPDSLKKNKHTMALAKYATLGKNSKQELVIDTDTGRCCELLFTSGTTGTSKCVMLSQKNVFAAINAACKATDFGPDDVLVSILPLHHTYELTCSLAAFCYGIQICVNDSLKHVLKSFKEYRPTGLVLVPLFVTTMYKKIMSEAKKTRKDRILPAASAVSRMLGVAGIDVSDILFKEIKDSFGGRLQKIVCGGAALDPKMVGVFDSFGISIYEGYGITECSPLVAVSPYYARKSGSVGPAVECCSIKIADSSPDENGNMVGEILVKGDNVMLGYMNNDEANREAFTEDGWFRTGDMGYMDEDGYLYITGRKKSVIVLENGKNVFPEEIEEYLSKIEEIAESVVVGREEDGSVKLTAIVYPNLDKFSSLSEIELKTEIQKQITALNRTLPSFKQIHRLEFTKTEFEKTTTKKIKRHLVK